MGKYKKIIKMALYIKRSSAFIGLHLDKDIFLSWKLIGFPKPRPPHSEETKEKIRQKHIGKPQSEEHKKKLSKIKTDLFKRGILKSPCYWKGKKRSEESKRKSRDIRIAYIENTKFNGKAMIPGVGKNETSILNELEKKMGYKILRKYKVLGYFLDGYIPELNYAIEIDEYHHKSTFLKDSIRELNIKKEIGCEFIRINEEDGLNGIEKKI